MNLETQAYETVLQNLDLLDLRQETLYSRKGFLLDLGDRGLFKFILMSRDLTHTLGSKVSFPAESPSTDSCYLEDAKHSLRPTNVMIG